MSNRLEPSLPHHCVSDIDEVNRRAANELTRVAEWMTRNSAQQVTLANEENAKKTMRDEVKLVAGHPESKPFWTDHSIALQCFACDFTQLTLKSYEKPLNLPWMTKRIKKDNSDMVISFCPACMSGEPWIIHFRNSFTSVSIAPKDRKPDAPLVTVKEDEKKTNENWPDLPTDVPHYRNRWQISDFYDKPNDWREQESHYEVLKKSYKTKKEAYDAFCAEKIAEIPPMVLPTMTEVVQRVEEERLIAFRERFAQRSAKRHNLSGFVPDPKLTKTQDDTEKHPFNSPPPTVITYDNKENSPN
jgi:hypothetical protein